jgi:hypothetical protein
MSAHYTVQGLIDSDSTRQYNHRGQLARVLNFTGVSLTPKGTVAIEITITPIF